jgi:ABC-type Mn2+/Zn2+ transport system permease subunit
MMVFEYEFMRNAFLSALLLGPTCALLGAFVTMRGMAFFSDALAHSALTGVALGFLLQESLSLPIDPMVTVLLFSFALATIMSWFFERTSLRPDTIISFSFTGSVALGILILHALDKGRLIHGLLFGSIYANDTSDLVKQAVLAVTVFTFLLWKARAYALASLQPDLARTQGIHLERLNYLFALLIAATVALSLKMAGALLISAMIVTPPAAARLVARSFRQFLILSILFGISGGGLGILLSAELNTPSGPTIVLTNLSILTAALALTRLRR